MITFIDLFCGIGGFRLALEELKAKCVFSAEVNTHACLMYEENFHENPYCDVTEIKEKELPEFDILCAGFPCQAFSRAGKQKGFDDVRGTLFFDICRIVKEKQPKVIFLENVKNLIIHDKGNTFKTILRHLDELNYEISYEVLSAKDFGVPQHRERIIIVGIRKDLNYSFDFKNIERNSVSSMIAFLDNTLNDYLKPEEYTIIDKQYQKTQIKSGLKFVGYRNKNIRTNGVLENTLHLSRAHKQCNRIYDSMGIHPTLSSQESSGRYFIYHQQKVRKLSLDECFRFMGFPQNFKKVGSKSNLYSRIGNSVCVPMIKSVGREIINVLQKTQ